MSSRGAYSHDRNVPARAGPLDDDVRWRFEDHIADEEDGQGEVVLVVGELEVGGQAEHFGISDVSPVCGVR